ncbi:MAG: extracellular solute-binding protein [Chloroflexota bacterium]
MTRRLFVLLLLVVCVACDGVSLPLTLPFPENTPTPTGTATVPPTPIVLPTATPGAQPEPEVGGTLRLWVPPEFDPSDGSAAAALFQARLEAFAQQNPGWRVEVRVKATEGPGGLLESLAAASKAASSALPDLVALPRPLLEMAAVRGLIRPFDALTTVMTSAEWYSYSRDLARIQNNIFGLPFAGDALVLIYRSASVSPPLASWQQLTATGLPMAFPVAEPRASYPLTLYRGAGGAVVNEQGQPSLDVDTLTQVLTFTLAAESAGVMPNWLGLYENYDQAWQVYLERRATLAVNWASRYLNEGTAGDSATLLPTPNGTPFAQATGWCWALVATDPNRQKMAAALAEFLVDGTYLTAWSTAAGVLPTRSTAAAPEGPSNLRDFATQVATVAVVYPPADVTAVLNPLLSQAVLQVFKLQVEPQVAAQQAVDALKPPTK